jgi:hypothetical protein
MGEEVSISFTLPPVSRPVRLSSANSTITAIPGLMSALRVPSMAIIFCGFRVIKHQISKRMIDIFAQCYKNL